MKQIIRNFILLAATFGHSAPVTDWPNLARYQKANAELQAPAADEARVVFMGDSITDAWPRNTPEFFSKNPYIGRGISGQTSPQMLLRFRQDVIALQPKVVVILAGTNDLAGNTGPMTPEQTMDNLASMVELAKAHGIRVVLASVPPATVFGWRREMGNPAERIIAMNQLIRAYAEKNGCVYLDYHKALADAENGLKKECQEDAVHPNQAGYEVMAPLAQKAIAEALSQN
jgi:lysophospholipase L1-like esterase